MPSKKYNNSRRNDKLEGDNEVLGIVLVIISAFILLCIIVRPILGIISRVIFGIVTGIFGLFSYPLFLSTLIWGIALIQGRKASLQTKFKIGIAFMVVSLMLILQLATTHSLLKESFSAYVSDTYKATTAGGVAFGVIAYAVQKVISIPVSYILYSLTFLCSLAFFIVLPIYKSRKNTIEEPRKEVNPFIKGTAAPKQIRPLNDNTLFVDTIRPVQADSAQVNNGFNSIESFEETPKRIEPIPEKKSAQFEPYSNKAAASGFKSEAHKILFGDQKRLISDMAAGHSPSNNNTMLSGFGYTLPPLTSAPDVKDYTTPSVPQPKTEVPETSKPQKRVHISDIPELNEIPLLPEKDISGQIVGSAGIINGDDLSKQLAESMAPIQKEKEKETYRPGAVEFATKKIDIPSLQIKENKPEEEERPSIVNGDYFGMPGSAKKESNASQNDAVSGFYETQSIKPNNHFDSNIQSDFRQQNAETDYINEEEMQNPIITGSEFENAHNAETRFQQLLNEERTRVSASQTSHRNTDSFDYKQTQNENQQIAEEPLYFTAKSPIEQEELDLISDDLPEQPRKESSFNIIDTPEDLSEQSHFEGNDSTGYYDSVSIADIKPVEKVTQPVRSSSQLKIDDYVASAPAPQKTKKRKRLKYNSPDIDMLVSSDSVAPENFNVACEEKARLLEETLQGLKLPVKVGAITRGPSVTRYELEMPPGIPIKRIEQFSTDIEYYLESNGKIRIEAPIPGKRAVGIEVPNEEIDIVRLRDIISSKEFQNSSSPLTLSLGKDIAGTNIVCNLEKMPHLLIAGATGSGKSACLNSIIISIMYKASPEEVRLILIDPKRVEFNMYQGIPHLLGCDIINDAQQAINALTWAKEEMDRRYILFGNHKVRNLPEFNKCDAVKSGEEQKLPYIVLIVDELAELMLDNNKKVLESKIMSMAQKARAAGIHLILATQRPSVDVITGTIKANLPSRIAFSVKSIVDSRTILDQCGAETLLGRGDMLYAPIGMDDPKRVQGAFVTEQEITAVTEYVRANNETDFDEEFTSAITKRNDEPDSDESGDDEDSKEFDNLMPEVLKCVIESGSASTSMIQRRFSVGYARASRIIDQMELHKFIGPLEGSKPRAVYISREQYKEIFGIDL